MPCVKRYYIKDDAWSSEFCKCLGEKITLNIEPLYVINAAKGNDYIHQIDWEDP